MDNLLSRKYFNDKATQAKEGDKYKIKKASKWHVGKGYFDYYWIDSVFVKYENNEAVFFDKMNAMNVYVTHRQIKVGEVVILWDKKENFQVNKKIEDNLVKLWDTGTLQPYK